MRSNLLLLIMLFCILGIEKSPMYWEDISDRARQNIIKSLDRQDVLLRFYFKEMTLKDDEDMDALLKRLLISSSNDCDLPLRFFVLNKICFEADGAVAESLSSVLAEFIYSYPDYSLAYLSRNPELEAIYVTLVATELDFKLNGLSNIPFSADQLFDRIRAFFAPNKEYLPAFINKVQKMMETVND